MSILKGGRPTKAEYMTLEEAYRGMTQTAKHAIEFGKVQRKSFINATNECMRLRGERDRAWQELDLTIASRDSLRQVIQELWKKVGFWRTFSAGAVAIIIGLVSAILSV